VLKSLLERDLVRILGKKDEPGRPMLYGTTAHFLEFFSLKALGDLPTLREFTELSDESRRTYERELGEDPDEISPTQASEGLMGAEGAFRRGTLDATQLASADASENPDEAETAALSSELPKGPEEEEGDEDDDDDEDDEDEDDDDEDEDDDDEDDDDDDEDDDDEDEDDDDDE
jgi:segregation and condensation protein B